MYFTVPLALIFTLPCKPWVTDSTIETGPSISVSFANTLISTAVSSFVFAISSITTLGSFVSVTYGVSLLVSSNEPSLTFRSIASRSPPALTTSIPACVSKTWLLSVSKV